MKTEPGIYPDVTMAEYIADPCPEPSLSTTTACLLLNRSALHAWWVHPRLGSHSEEASSRAELGSAVHAALFGGASVVYAPPEFSDWRKKDAQTFRDGCRERGEIPLLDCQRDQVENMAGPARERLKALGVDRCEQTVLWNEDGVWGRSRPDIMTADTVTIVDYKTTANAAPASWIRSTIIPGGYDVQAGLCLRGIEQLRGAARRDFLFLVQEIDPPHAMSVISLGPEFIGLAERKVQAAMNMWAECLRSKAFPSYDPRTHYAEPPTWALMEAEVLS